MLEPVTSFFDPLLIAPYRALLIMGGHSLLAFFLGTFLLAGAATVVGELTMAGVYWLNRRTFAELRREMITHNNLSVKAIGLKDKESYKACNHMANEYFGRNLFLGFTLFASSLWPAFLVLAWMGSRFGNLAIPVWGLDMRYHALFILIYIPARIAFGLNKKRIWPFSRIQSWIARNEDCGEQLMTFGDLLPKERSDAKGKTDSNPA